MKHLQQLNQQLGASKVARVGQLSPLFIPEEVNSGESSVHVNKDPKHDTWKSRCDARVGVRLPARFAGRPAGRASVCVAR